MNQEILDKGKSNVPSQLTFSYIAIILFLASISYHIYLIYSMRVMAYNFAQYVNKQGGEIRGYFLQYNLNFIPLYIISGISFTLIIWWVLLNKQKNKVEYKGISILILSSIMCFVPTEHWFG